MARVVSVRLVAGGSVRVDLDTVRALRLLIRATPLLDALARRLGRRPGGFAVYRLGRLWFVGLRPAGILPGAETWHELTPGERAAWRIADALADPTRFATDEGWIVGSRAALRRALDRHPKQTDSPEQLAAAGAIDLERIAVPGPYRPLFRMRVLDK